MSSTRYTKDHEYIRIEGDTGTIGITDYAQGQLGDVVFVDLPNVGAVLKQGAQAAVVESVKAASEVYSPVSGAVIAINTELEAAPGTVNADAAGKGWFMRLKLSNMGELDGLMDEAAYLALVKAAH